MSNEAEQEKLLARWLSGELSPEERQRLEAEGGLDDLRFALDDIERWKLPDMDVDRGLENVMDRAFREPPQKKAKQVFFQPLMRIAASLLLVAAAYFVINNLLTSGATTLTTGPGETLSHVLPDGSQVELDANSRLTYSQKDWDEERNLSMDGRALFTVEKGSSFKVDTESGSVTVLGTIFDVERFDTDLLKVNCYEGRVRVDLLPANNKELLSAGQGLISEQSTVTRLTVDPKRPDWVRQISKYDTVNLSAVIKDLERHHGVSIKLPPQMATSPFNGELFYGDLDSALSNLSSMFELKYTRTAEGEIVFE
ncbi:MAG: FecR domain-containing protein [Roseivirga sp.]